MPRPLRLLSLATPLAFLAVWEAAARLHAIDVRFFPAPSSILADGWQTVRTGELWANLRVSVARILVGFALGAIPGAVLGILMGLIPWVRAAGMPLVSAVYPIPKSAILPLIMLIFGIGELSKWVFIAIGVFFPVLINALAGVLTIERIYLDVGRAYGARGPAFLRTIALPGALPVLFAGIKLGFGLALILVVIAEIVSSRAGIGFMIWNAWQIFDVEKLYTGLIVIGLLGYLSTEAIDAVERLVVPWKPRA
ncbi:MAG TPA: ABC transporter permease [bacterium]|nr:ABC transporter permease [bacterium]